MTMRRALLHISWKLLLITFVGVVGIVSAVKWTYHTQKLIVFASNGNILDVQTGISRPEPHEFYYTTACSRFQSQTASARPVSIPPSWRPPPAWHEHKGSFLGWSPQDNYLLDNQDGQTRLWDTSTRRVIYTTPENVERYAWSPDDRYLVLILTSGTPTLRLLSLDTLKAVDFTLPAAPVRYTTNVLWSPDVQLFALYYTDRSNGSWLDVYSVDGSLAKQAITPRLYGEYEVHRYIHWSADSTALHFWQDMYDHYRLSAYDVQTGTTQEVTRTARDPIYPTNDNHIAAAYYDNGDGTYSVELIDMATLVRTPLIEHADDLGNPTFNPDWVAVVYDAAHDAVRDLRLAWMRLDGSGRGEYGDPAYVDIRHVEWALQGDRVLFVGIYPDDTYDLVVIDLLTGQATKVFERAPDIVFIPNRSDSRAWWAYAYTDANEQWHLVGLSRTLSPLFKLETDVYIHRVQEAISPDDTHTVLKLHGQYPVRYLAFGHTDEMTPRIIKDDLPRDQVPTWSPDGTLVMVQEETSTGAYEMVFYNPQGDVVFRYPTGYGTWWSCDS